MPAFRLVVDAVRLDHAGKDAERDQQDQRDRDADTPAQGSHRAVGGALVDHHVIQPSAQVPYDHDQESDDQEFLHVGEPRDDVAIIRHDRRLVVKVRLALLLLAVALIIAFVSLGRWQLQRAEEKQQMLGAVAKALERQQAQALDSAAASTTGDYVWVSGRGQFRPAPVLLLDNQRRGHQVGVRVFGIFQPTRGSALLVDLGWLPLPGDRRLPRIDLPAGEQAIAGLMTPPPSSGIAVGPAYAITGSGQWLLTRVDTSALSEGLQVRLAPRILRLDPALPLGYARDLDVLPNTLPPERHRGYALQWFGLALAVLLLALIFGFRRRHK